MSPLSSPPPSWHAHLADESGTRAFGAALLAAIEGERTAIAAQGLVIALSGDLGAGKTTVVRALLREAGVTGPIKSPTFAVLEPYVVSSLDFYHFDFYRFTGATEFDDVGFREFFGPARICAIEWPERVAGSLPTPDLRVTLRVQDLSREVEVVATSELGHRCLTRISAAMPAAAA